MKKTVCFLFCAGLFCACNQNKGANNEASVKDSADQKMVSSRGYDFAANNYIDLAKKGVEGLASGDVDAFTSVFADNAIYRWSGGDSLNGKAAISEYWKKRRSEVIESLSYSSQAWLPIQVTVPMYPGQLTGNYSLFWCIVNAKYKSGKSMTQRMHMVFHFDAQNKIDRVTQYLDRVPINEAMKK